MTITETTETTETSSPPRRVDIATDPVLGQRLSALRYTREVLTDNSSAFLSNSAKLSTSVDDLLTVADWLLDDEPSDLGDDQVDEEGAEPLCRVNGHHDGGSCPRDHPIDNVDEDDEGDDLVDGCEDDVPTGSPA